STDNIDLENASINIFFEKFDGDEILQIDVKLPDFDTNNNDLVMEEFFDFKTLEEQNMIEKDFHSQQNINVNQDWSIDDIFQFC
ncbi:6225_t:CDS:1, partial [Racocetra fulgida]